MHQFAWGQERTTFFANPGVLRKHFKSRAKLLHRGIWSATFISDTYNPHGNSYNAYDIFFKWKSFSNAHDYFGWDTLYRHICLWRPKQVGDRPGTRRLQYWGYIWARPKVPYFFICPEKLVFDHFSAKIEWVSIFYFSVLFLFRPLKMSECEV